MMNNNTMNNETAKMINDASTFTFDELEGKTTSKKKVENNEALKEERAKRIRRRMSYICDEDTVTVEMRDGHDNLLGKEVFTEEDMKLLAQEKGEKIINRKLAKERSEARKKAFGEGMGIYAQSLGYYMIGYAVGYTAVKLIKKVLKK